MNAKLRPCYIYRIDQGAFLGGTIDHDRTPNCHKCDQPWGSQESFGYSIPCCAGCKTYPKKFRIRRYLPSSGSDTGGRRDIRYDKKQNRIVDPLQAITIMRQIDDELEAKTFDPKEYESREYAKNFLFGTFIDSDYIPFYENKVKSSDLAPTTMSNKLNLIKLYLRPYFSEIDIRTIDYGEIMKFSNGITHSPRQRDLATAELRVILNHAIDMGHIKDLPKFPKIKKSKMREDITPLTWKEQHQIIAKIDHPIYKLAITMLCLYPIRPCDLRALRWKDVYRDEGKIKISQHFSGSKIKSGRKSTDKSHVMPIIDEMFEVLEALPKGIGEAPLFPGDRGGFISERTLARAWARAIKLTDIPYIELYVGTKHSIMTDLGENHTNEDLASVAGIDKNTTPRYNLPQERSRLDKQRRILNGRNKK